MIIGIHIPNIFVTTELLYFPSHQSNVSTLRRKI